MRESEVLVNENGTLRVVLDAQMSKMSPEQRVALASLNLEAKKRSAEIAAFDAAKEKDMLRPECDQDGPGPCELDTPFKEAHGEDIAVPEEKCLPDPLAPVEGYDLNVDREGAYLKTQSLRYTQATLAVEFERIFKNEVMKLRDAGQKEYAHDEESPFANFERGAEEMGIDRKQVLWIYAMKHKDGIASYLKGHVSQREDVRGRIADLIVYLLLFYGMVNEETGTVGVHGLGDLE